MNSTTREYIPYDKDAQRYVFISVNSSIDHSSSHYPTQCTDISEELNLWKINAKPLCMGIDRHDMVLEGGINMEFK